MNAPEIIAKGSAVVVGSSAWLAEFLMNTEQQKGYDFTKGCALYLSRLFVIGWLLVGGYNLARNHFAWGVDSTDRDGKTRSGLTVHTDYKTGVEYLSDGNGGLTRRESR